MLIADGDKRNVEAMKLFLHKLATDYIEDGEHSIDWEKVSWIDTLNTMLYNLENAKHYFKPYEGDGLFFTCECECGWWGSSEFLTGGGQIADTGDYSDCYCPVCGSTDIYDKE